MKIMQVKVVHLQGGKETITVPVANNHEAVNCLRAMARDGIKCIRWEMIECSRNG